MIGDAFIWIAFNSIKWFLGLFSFTFLDPIKQAVIDNMSTILGFFQTAAAFVPWTIVVLCIGNIIAWIYVHIVISIIRFILDFVPLM